MARAKAAGDGAPLRLRVIRRVKLEIVCEMGFDVFEAYDALTACGSDERDAVSLLLRGPDDEASSPGGVGGGGGGGGGGGDGGIISTVAPIPFADFAPHTGGSWERSRLGWGAEKTAFRATWRGRPVALLHFRKATSARVVAVETARRTRGRIPPLFTTRMHAVVACRALRA